MSTRRYLLLPQDVLRQVNARLEESKKLALQAQNEVLLAQSMIESYFQVLELQGGAPDRSCSNCAVWAKEEVKE